MERKEWEELDRLLGLEGFGGYYDLVECLKDIARSWVDDMKDHFDNFNKITAKVDGIKTIKTAVSLLQAIDIIKRGRNDERGTE